MQNFSFNKITSNKFYTNNKIWNLINSQNKKSYNQRDEKKWNQVLYVHRVSLRKLFPLSTRGYGLSNVI